LGQFSKNYKLFIQKINTKLSKIWFMDQGSKIGDSNKTYSGSRIQRSKRPRIRIRNTVKYPDNLAGPPRHHGHRLPAAVGQPCPDRLQPAAAAAAAGHRCRCKSGRRFAGDGGSVQSEAAAHGAKQTSGKQQSHIRNETDE
jgi:hypothetical protein